MPADLSFADVLNTPVDFDALDRPDAPTRIRLNATVIRVEHAAGGVAVIYEKDGKLYRTRAPRGGDGFGGMDQPAHDRRSSGRHSRGVR